MFNCQKCGACCSCVGMSELYVDLDRGDGKCKFFDEKSKLCTIYENRPLKCNIDKTYELYYKGKISKKDYYELNYDACKKLRKKLEE